MRMVFCVGLLITVLLSAAATGYQTRFNVSSPGKYFQYRFSMQLLSTTMIESVTKCASKCSQLLHCRTFDYDPSSKQCRLFEADSTTGTIASSASTTSVVGSVRITSDLYSSMHNQSCTACTQNRYEVCSSNTSTCQCPSRTYWNGQMCLLQLFENDKCTQRDACRSDLNLTCALSCYGRYQRCVQDNSSTNWNGTFGVRHGITVAGQCAGNASTNQTRLSWPADVLLTPNGTLYVADYDRRVLAFDQGNRTGRTVATFDCWPTFMYFDNRTSELYVSVLDLHLVYVLPSNRTIPPDGFSTPACNNTRLDHPTAVVTDSMGNVYISSTCCNRVMKWAPNASHGIVVAGSTNGTPGSNALLLSFPYGLALDEANGYLYVADRNNSRIQRFPINGSPTGVTIAGGNGTGAAPNQLNYPTEILLSKDKASIYIADYLNNRVQKWFFNHSSGTTIAGSSTGLAGRTASLMDGAYAIALDSQEDFLYVTDTDNYRIQRFELN